MNSEEKIWIDLQLEKGEGKQGWSSSCWVGGDLRWLLAWGSFYLRLTTLDYLPGLWLLLCYLCMTLERDFLVTFITENMSRYQHDSGGLYKDVISRFWRNFELWLMISYSTCVVTFSLCILKLIKITRIQDAKLLIQNRSHICLCTRRSCWNTSHSRRHWKRDPRHIST